jgi:hypothetical protein
MVPKDVVLRKWKGACLAAASYLAMMNVSA